MKSPKERPLQIENFYINRLRGKTKTAAAGFPATAIFNFTILNFQLYQ